MKKIILCTLLNLNISLASGEGSGTVTTGYDSRLINPPNFNLSEVQVSKVDAKERKTKIDALNSQISKQNLGFVANSLREIYSMNVFEFVEDQTLTGSNGDSLMNNLVRYYFNYHLTGTYLEHATETAVPGKGSLSEFLEAYQTYLLNPICYVGKTQKSIINFDGDYTECHCLNQIKNNQSINGFFPFALTTYTESATCENFIGFHMDVELPFPTLNLPRHVNPSMISLHQALQKLKVQTFNATVVFMAIDLPNEEMYSVIYPINNGVQPIHQPIVIISENAGLEHVEHLIINHLGSIHKYNNSYDKNVYPEALNISQLIRDNGAFDSNLENLLTQVSEFNKTQIAIQLMLAGQALKILVSDNGINANIKEDDSLHINYFGIGISDLSSRQGYLNLSVYRDGSDKRIYFGFDYQDPKSPYEVINVPERQ